MTTNIILLHTYQGKEIARISFGENISKAIEFTAVIIKNSYQIGDHDLLVKDEISGKVLFTRTYRILGDNK